MRRYCFQVEYTSLVQLDQTITLCPIFCEKIIIDL